MSPRLTDAEAVRCIAGVRSQQVVVLTMSGLGFWPAPAERDFRLVGLMGAAASLGLGIALGAPDQPVWVLDGDGSALMRMGVLAAVGDAAPANLTHIVLDNGVYSVSGGQPVPVRPRWDELASGAGYRSAQRCATAVELRDALLDRQPGPRLLAVVCERAGIPFAPEALVVTVSDEARRLRAELSGR